VVDCGFIGLELAQVMAATEKVRTQIKRWAQMRETSLELSS